MGLIDGLWLRISAGRERKESLDLELESGSATGKRRGRVYQSIRRT